jgi:hypothetical protein
LIEFQGDIQSRRYRLTAAGSHHLVHTFHQPDQGKAITTPDAVLAATRAGRSDPSPTLIMTSLACLSIGTITRLPGLTALATRMRP